MGIYGYFTDRESDGEPLYTDLACERHRADTSIPGVEYRKTHAVCGYWESLKICSAEAAESIGKPMGIYDTLSLDRFDLIDMSTIEDAADEISRELCILCEHDDILPERVLIVGLGNPDLTPDALGPAVAKRIKATGHIKKTDKRLFDILECSEITVVTPGVRSFSGMEAYTTVKGLCSVCLPSLIITVDSIATVSAKRLGSTIQLCTGGVCPGSGIGNCSEPLTKQTLGTPVISIGVPTVIDSRSLCGEICGCRGSESMLVSPREICEIIEVGAEIIALGINQAFGIYS